MTMGCHSDYALGLPLRRIELGNEHRIMGFLDKIFRGSSEPSPRVKELMDQMKSDDPALRAVACAELGEMGEEAKAATELLEELLQDEDGKVCIAAAGAIAKVVRGF